MYARPDSGSEDIECTSAGKPEAHRAPWRLLVAAAGGLAAVATIGTVSWLGRSAQITFKPGALTNLVEKEGISEQESVCSHLPFLRIMKLVSSNLGGGGPDKDAEEGLVYKVKGFHMGLSDADDLEIHIHATNEYHTHHKKEGEKIDEDEQFDPEYKPAWPKENGIKGHFASVNIKPGSNVTLRVHAYDKTKKKDLVMERFAMTFFDLDTGKDNVRSVEYVRLGGFDNFFTTNATEVNVSKMEDGTYLFKATKEGNGDDNPDDPLQLTPLQKNRVVSLVFSKLDEVKFEVGATAGKTARVFNFCLRPALRCAWTKMPDGNLIASDAKDSPLTILKGSASGAGPTAAIIAIAAALFFAH